VLEKIRLSIGTAISLGLRRGALPDPPTTAYLMVGSRCINNCAFCTQAREADSSGDLLSRVVWPEFDMDTALKALTRCNETGINRICIQCLIDPVEINEIPELVKILADRIGVSISVSISAVDRPMLERLKDAGASRVGIALDGASEEVFDRIKGADVGNPYTWEGNWRSLGSAVEIFGRGHVSTHIIVGLGETDEDIVRTMIKCMEEGVLASLFAYTSMKGTQQIGDPPELERYRALQVARAIIMDKGVLKGFKFDEDGKLIDLPSEVDLDPEVIFQTRGCPDCNRPYYNERPGGPLYNFPRRLDEEESRISKKEAYRYING
jgi:biotin synthase